MRPLAVLVGLVPVVALAGCPNAPAASPVGAAVASSPSDAAPSDAATMAPVDPAEALALREAAAEAALRALPEVQSQFREGDLEEDGYADYGSLEELRAAGLGGVLDAAEGYVFEVRPAEEAPEFLWFAVAHPAEGLAGRTFFTNQSEEVYDLAPDALIDPIGGRPPEGAREILPVESAPPEPQPSVDMPRYRAVVAALGSLAEAQRAFKRAVNAYGELADLRDRELVEGDLAEGSLDGYRIEVRAVRPGGGRPSTWMAVANPEVWGETGDVAFATNQAGVIHCEWRSPVVLDDRCRIPDGARPLPEGPVVFEDAAIETLRVIVPAQSLFRERDAEGDGEQDYARLDELAGAELVDADVAAGPKYGYRFHARPGAAPEFQWFALARPEKDEPGRTFFVNENGVIFVLDPAQPIPTDSTTPEGARPIRR